MRVHVPKERAEGETRVAATPETVEKMVGLELEVTVEAGAGMAAHFLDGRYEKAGGKVVEDGDAAWAEADAVLTVATPTPEAAGKLKEGAVLIGFMNPYGPKDTVKALRDRKVSTLAMELVPRISRAQSMDALSSQASIAGYKAVLVAAAELDKYFPLLMTAAGTIQPARVVVMGAGVAGLQAIATAKRLGAVVEVSDIRPEVKEQVESLGGRFIELPEMVETDDKGYAKEVTADFLKKQQEIVAQRLTHADVVVTTALVPGKKAPVLVTEQMLKDMREGAVVVDLAVAQGGNCELSELNETVVKHGVTIIGHPNLPATVPADASIMYARNVLELVKLTAKEGKLELDLEDEIIEGALLTHGGEVRHPATRDALEKETSS